MRSSPPSLRSYSFIIFGFCLIFLVFGYRSLRRSGSSSKMASDSDEEFGDELADGKSAPGNLAKLLQARCNAKKLERLGEYGICTGKALNREKNCLLFSVSSNPNLKFETHISEQMDKCKLRVYGHESIANDEEAKFKILEKIEGERLTEKILAKILGTEKKGKIHLLRMDAGMDTVKLAQTKLLKERQICHLLLTVSIGDTEELGSFVLKMKQTYGFNLYAISPFARGIEASPNGGTAQKANDEEDEEEEEEEGEDVKKTKGNDDNEEDDGENGRKYALSFIQQSCQKSYDVKAN